MSESSGNPDDPDPGGKPSPFPKSYTSSDLLMFEVGYQHALEEFPGYTARFGTVQRRTPEEYVDVDAIPNCRKDAYWTGRSTGTIVGSLTGAAPLALATFTFDLRSGLEYLVSAGVNMLPPEVPIYASTVLQYLERVVQ